MPADPVQRFIIALLLSLCVAGSARAVETVPLKPPSNADIPKGPLGDAIRYGQSLITNTRALAGGYVGNGLTCANCHLDAGRVAYSAPLAGLWGVFPEYRARRGSVESL
ncbi:MAG TPA: cytochrome C, partial [Casimicrobiaceae bacterium]